MEVERTFSGKRERTYVHVNCIHNTCYHIIFIYINKESYFISLLKLTECKFKDPMLHVIQRLQNPPFSNFSVVPLVNKIYNKYELMKHFDVNNR